MQNCWISRCWKRCNFLSTPKEQPRMRIFKTVLAPADMRLNHSLRPCFRFPGILVDCLPPMKGNGFVQRNNASLYRYTCLAIWLISSMMIVLDRFYWNVWPRQTICSPGCGGDFFCDMDEVQYVCYTEGYCLFD